MEGITQEMARQAIDEAQSKWVEGTNYDVLLRGGVEALRLFLTTPELSKEFPALADAKAKAGFAATLDSALDEIKPTNRMDAGRMHDLMAGILKSNDETVKLPEAVALMEFTDGAMEKLDPFTAVIWPHEADEFEKSTSGIFGGVGIQIMLDPAGLLKVVSPLEETPAINAGIQAGDTIVGIDGKSASGISIDQAVHRIMGPPDTKVSLTIKRDGVKDPIVYDLTRANIHVSSVKGYKRDPADPTKWLFMIDPDTHIGYIRITGFQKDTPKNLADAIESLKKQGVEGIVLDLRFNPGGLLSAAIEMSDMFLDKGTIVSTKGNRTRYWAASADGKTLVPNTLPVVVLVNQYSASASEIMSGAMKDLHRALIVGQRSFGKGSVQNVIELGSSKAAIKLTMSYYYLPNMESLHRRDRDKTWGVEPDVPVEMTPQQIGALIKSRRDADIIAKAGMTLPSSDPAPSTAPATGPAGAQPATQKAPEPLIDTQLDTALLMLRLQLLQRRV